jgi:hypothetical protein
MIGRLRPLLICPPLGHGCVYGIVIPIIANHLGKPKQPVV